MNKYKKSQYNYVVKNNFNSYIIYNSFYSSVIKLDEEEYEQYRDHFEDMDTELKDILYQQGFLVDTVFDEEEFYYQLRKIYQEIDQERLDITVAVTTRCNARCFYCYENGIKSEDMSVHTAEKLIKFLQQDLKIKKIHINWFGGEPLLNVEIIQYLVNRLNEIGIPFDSMLITNGMLLSETDMNVMKNNWNLKTVQITLDGLEETYNKIKNYKYSYKNPFQVILSNIQKLLDVKINVSIRINISKNNYEESITLVQFLRRKFALAKNLMIYTAFLTLPNERDNEIREEERVECMRKILDELPFNSYYLAVNKIKENPIIYPCMNSDPQSYVFDANGDIYKCEHFIGKGEKRIASLYDNNLIERLQSYQSNSIEKEEECRKCSFFPKCLAGCYAHTCEDSIACTNDKYIIKAYLKSIF